MGLTSMNKIRPILITGKTGTGKTTKAKSLIDNPIIFYANDIDYNIDSIPIEQGIIIEDIHVKPDKASILSVLRHYKGQVVLTSISEKSVPKEIKAMCQIKRAGAKKHLSEQIKEIAPRSQEPFSYEKDTYSLVMEFLKSTDRDLVKDLLLFNKPSDIQILTWLSENMHPNRLIFVDGVVKRKWSQRYFYEMLAYTHMGNNRGRLSMPTRKQYSKIPYLSKKLGVKNPKLLKQLMKDEQFREWAKTKLSNTDCRILKLGEKKRRRRLAPIELQYKSLFQFGDEKNEI